MKKPVSVSLPARMEHLASFITPVLDAARTLSIGDDRLNDLELCMEESLVNIFTHAYPDRDGMAWVSCVADRGRFTVLIEDEGMPFSVTEAEAPDFTADILDRPIGGLGVHLIRSLMDETAWRHEGNRNILTLVLFLPSGQEAQ